MALSKEKKNILLGLAFLSPNILGFLALTVIPLVLSLILAFTDWNLTLHNMFRPENTIKFVGIDNFIRLFQEGNFVKYLGNTLFFMMGIPFGIGGSLLLATLLSRNLTGGTRKVFASLILAAVFAASIAMLLAYRMEATAMMILFTGIAGVMLVAGVSGGSTIYRTLFYLPSFTAGVAVYILWLKLYNPVNGPINNALVGPLRRLTELVHTTNPGVYHTRVWLCVLIVMALAIWGMRKLRSMWIDGELGWAAAIVPAAFMILPSVIGYSWLDQHASSEILLICVLGYMVYLLIMCKTQEEQDFTCAAGNGFGSAAMLGLTLMVAQFMILGVALIFKGLPVWVADAIANGDTLNPPKWLNDYHWAKPAIMIMGFWSGIGSNNMLLYLAGLSNIPQELYEAADIDGAGPFQRFWNVTWPQLAPTTFFIVVMSIIGGLQGGFEMARTMTQGGPNGATTTLSYFIYNEGFTTGRLGYSSAIAWTLFALVFTVTMINWKFGNRYVND